MQQIENREHTGFVERGLAFTQTTKPSFDSVVNYGSMLAMTRGFSLCDQAVTVEDILLDPRVRVGQAYSVEDALRLKREIQQKIRGNKLEVAFAAFPFKIQNPLKTIGDDPDAGELVVLQRLKGIGDAAQRIGVELSWNIIADGGFYADELHVGREVAENYVQKVKDLARAISLSAKFYELDELAAKDNVVNNRLDYFNDLEKSFVVRTAGMINTREYEQELKLLYSEHKSIPKAMEVLLENNSDFRKKCEISAAIYQQRKNSVEEQNIFNKHFHQSVRASIQIDVNRNLLGNEIHRPLAIRITQSKSRNLFPWLGLGYFDGKEWSNIYASDAKDRNLSLSIMDGLMFYSK